MRQALAFSHILEYWSDAEALLLLVPYMWN